MLAYLAVFPARSAPQTGSAEPILGTRPRIAVQEGFEFVGHLAFDYEIGDLFYYGGDSPTVYVGNYRPCGHGVAIVDVSDPSAPEIVGRASGFGNVSYEDVVVRRIGEMDVLATGVQWCDSETEGGLALYDVTDRTDPTLLSFLPTPSHGVHELDLVARPDGTVLALLAVPHAERDSLESASPDGDFWIVDLTDPTDPERLTEWGIVADSSLQLAAGDSEIESTEAGIGGYASYYGHSVRAADEGSTAYVSYWDGGVMKFDISDPANPRLLWHTHFDAGEEGDAHSMTYLDRGGTRYILQNDEEIDNLSPVMVTTSATGDRVFPAIEYHFMPTKLFERGRLAGEVWDAGDGCDHSAFDGAAGAVVLFDAVDPEHDRPRCPLRDQLESAAAAGARAALINLISPDRPSYFRYGRVGGMPPGLPAVAVAAIDGVAEELRDALSGGDRPRVELVPQKPAWGALQIYDESTARDIDGDGTLDLRRIGEFGDIPVDTGVEYNLPLPESWWTIHNTEVVGDVAYSSWYSDGIVALDLSDVTSPRLLGRFVPGGDEASLMWGVAPDPDRGIVFGSDIRTGLWAITLTG